ncbi:MAG: BatA domain-containing protein [Sulfuricurvum sp.]|nr:BatA domain-containing protein [Sulfuricurvum sp.]
MSFLHPEFLFWMIPFVGVLFYFWFTQKRDNEYYFTPEALQKLRVSESNLDITGRNSLFLSASLLIIIALAQPVVQQEKIVEAPSTVTIALDISTHSIIEFEAMKTNARHLVDEFEGALELVAFDSKVYRISPVSQDKKTLKELIKNLSPRIMNSEISDENNVYTVCKTSGIAIVGNTMPDRQEIETLRKPKEHWIYFQLFYFPLGLAMIFIAIALSSMSKRQSVSMALVFMIFIGESDVRAGVMEFRLLEKAKDTYLHGEYEQSARLFGEYQRLHDSPQVRYNCANAYFKAGDYMRARYWYEHVVTDDPKLREWVEINLAKLPFEKSKELPKGSNKSEKTVKKESKKVEEVIRIQNATPLFVY